MGDAGAGLDIGVTLRDFGDIDFGARQSAQAQLAGIERVGIGLGQCDRERRHVGAQVVNFMDLLFFDIGLAEGGNGNRHGLDAFFPPTGGHHDFLKTAAGRSCGLIGLSEGCRSRGKSDDGGAGQQRR